MADGKPGKVGNLNVLHFTSTDANAGNSDAARTAWQHALTILTDLDHPDADAIHTKLRDLDVRTLGPEDDRGR